MCPFGCTNDLYSIFMEDVISARYAGRHLVGEERCHHLAFEHDDIDYQLWLSEDEQPALRKLVITYKHEPGEPQYTMTVLEVEQLRFVDESRFAADLPPSAEEIEIVPIGKGSGR